MKAFELEEEAFPEKVGKVFLPIFQVLFVAIYAFLAVLMYHDMLQ